MKNSILFGFLFVALSVGGFMATSYWLNTEVATQSAESGGATKVIHQEYEDLSAGELIERGKVLFKDKKFAESFKMMEAAFSKSKPHSNQKKKSASYLGYHYLYGKGVNKDIAKAYDYYSVPELAGARSAIYRVGLILKDTNFAGYNLDKAREYLIKAEKLGVKAATRALKKNGR